MHPRTLAITLSAALVVTACGDELKDAFPRKSEVTVDVPEPAAGSSRAGLTRSALVGAPADLYASTYYESKKLNVFGAFVVELIERITALPTSERTETRAVWGPLSDRREPNEFRLTVEKVSGRTNTQLEWVLEGRPKSGGEDAWVALVLGVFEPAGADEGRGFFEVDFDVIGTLDPSEDARGRIAYAFDRSSDGASVRARFEGPDERGLPAQAAYAFGEKAGEGFILFAISADLHHPDEGQDAPEDLVIRTRWTSSGAGRVDVYARGGDLEALFAEGTQCFDDRFASTYEAMWIDGTLLEAAGDDSTCVLARATPTPEDLPSETEVARPE